MSEASLSASFATRPSAFHTTRWSLVLRARALDGPTVQGTASPDAAASLEILCRQYWPPLYAYVRARGHLPHDAQDLTQEFFSRLLAKNWLASADPARGRFRAFLLMALKRFLANAWDHASAEKRGGGQQAFVLDPEVLAQLPAPAGPMVAGDVLFDRQWALALLQSVMRRLRAEHTQAGRAAEYELLKPCLVADRGTTDYAALAERLEVTPASARSAVHRARKRFRELFREEVAATVEDPAEVEDEMRSIIAALGNG